MIIIHFHVQLELLCPRFPTTPTWQNYFLSPCHWLLSSQPVLLADLPIGRKRQLQSITLFAGLKMNNIFLINLKYCAHDYIHCKKKPTSHIIYMYLFIFDLIVRKVYTYGILRQYLHKYQLPPPQTPLDIIRQN